MYNRKFKLKAFGHVVFKNENGDLLAKASVHCDSKSHRDGVVKSMIGVIANPRFIPITPGLDMNVVERIVVDKHIERVEDVRHPSKRG